MAAPSLLVSTTLAHGEKTDVLQVRTASWGNHTRGSGDAWWRPTSSQVLTYCLQPREHVLRPARGRAADSYSNIIYLLFRGFKLDPDGLAHLAEPILDHRDEQVRAAAQLRVVAVGLDRDLLDLRINRPVSGPVHETKTPHRN